MDGDRFDYIIVGAGTAGSVLVNRLSADRMTTVLVLEAGGRDDWLWIHIPVGYLYCIGDPRTDWGYRTEPEAGLGGRALAYPRGRVLGGCTSINGMIYMRGQPADYDAWRDLGNPGWGWSDVLPLFRRSEDFHAGADDEHGAGGEWRVERQRLSWPLLDAFRDACAEAGIPRDERWNGGDRVGSSYFLVNQKRGVRWSAAKAFLRPALARANVELRTGVRVTRVIVEAGRATGVEVVGDDGGVKVLRARREVLLAAGSIGSPAILERSGIGDGARLSALGIPLLRHLPGVGENLQDHLQLRCIFKVQGVDTLNARARTALGKAKIGLEYLLNRSGPLSMAPSQLGVFAKSRPEIDRPDIEFHVQPLSLERFGEPLHPFPAFTAAPCNLRPSSRGSTHIASRGVDAAPRIRPNYLGTDEDRGHAAASIRLARRIVAQPALARFAPEEYRPGVQYKDDEAELTAAAAQVGTTIFHPVGTARMGSDERAVVDAELRVHGVAGLRIVDASIMPTITSGNTASPVIMIAEKAADLIRRRP